MALLPWGTSISDQLRAERPLGAAASYRAARQLAPTLTTSIVIPTRDEAPNIPALVERLRRVLHGVTAEVVFVDDSSDGTRDAIRRAANRLSRVQLLERDDGERWGGLGGAVVDGFGKASGDWVVVMDADLQHPPELVAALLARALQGDADIVVASRYARGGRERARWPRRALSRLSATIAKSLFADPLDGVTDPMSGFFAVRRDAIDLQSLHPHGFKILLELLVQTPALCVAEVGYEFGDRLAGRSKASAREAVRYLTHLRRLQSAHRRRVRDAARR